MVPVKHPPHLDSGHIIPHHHTDAGYKLNAASHDVNIYKPVLREEHLFPPHEEKK